MDPESTLGGWPGPSGDDAGRMQLPRADPRGRAGSPWPVCTTTSARSPTRRRAPARVRATAARSRAASSSECKYALAAFARGHAAARCRPWTARFWPGRSRPATATRRCSTAAAAAGRRSTSPGSRPTDGCSARVSLPLDGYPYPAALAAGSGRRARGRLGGQHRGRRPQRVRVGVYGTRRVGAQAGHGLRAPPTSTTPTRVGLIDELALDINADHRVLVAYADENVSADASGSAADRA